MLWPLDQLADHGLDDPNVAVQHPADNTSDEGNPVVRSKADDEQRQHCTCASEQEHRFTTNTVR